MQRPLLSLVVFMLALFSVTLSAEEQREQNAPKDFSAELDTLIENLTGTFTSQAGVNGGAETLYATRLPDFHRAVYVEIRSTDESAEKGEPVVLYQAVWKLHQVQNEMRWQFWSITTPEKFVGIQESEKLRDELWMYQLRELDCCEMSVQETTGTYTARTLHGDCCVLGESLSQLKIPGVLNVTANKSGFVLETNHTGTSSSARFVKQQPTPASTP